MKYRIQYSKAAIRDFDRIWMEVLEASKDYEITEQYISDLMDKFETKSDYPESGSPLFYEDSFTGYYFIVFKAYIAFYRVENDKLLVDRVLYGQSDYIRKLHLFPCTND